MSLTHAKSVKRVRVDASHLAWREPCHHRHHTRLYFPSRDTLVFCLTRFNMSVYTAANHVHSTFTRFLLFFFGYIVQESTILAYRFGKVTWRNLNKSVSEMGYVTHIKTRITSVRLLTAPAAAVLDHKSPQCGITRACGKIQRPVSSRPVVMLVTSWNRLAVCRRGERCSHYGERPGGNGGEKRCLLVSATKRNEIWSSRLAEEDGPQRGCRDEYEDDAGPGQRNGYGRRFFLLWTDSTQPYKRNNYAKKRRWIVSFFSDHQRESGRHW